MVSGTVGMAWEPPMTLVASVSRRRAPGPGEPPFPITGPDGERRTGESVISVFSNCLWLLKRERLRARGSGLRDRADRVVLRKLLERLVVWPERALLDVPDRERAQVN